jgi:hypothetical protein
MAVSTTREAGRLRVKSDAPSTYIQARLSIGRADSQQIHVARLTAQNGFRGFNGLARQSERRGEIVSASDGYNTQNDVGPERRIRQRLKRSVPAHRQKRALLQQNGILRRRFELSGAARSHKFCVDPERSEQSLDLRQTRTRPASSRCGIDEHDDGRIAHSGASFGAGAHVSSLCMELADLSKRFPNLPLKSSSSVC